MATISKFYLLDAASPNTGTLPSGVLKTPSGTAATGDATGARTARDATDVAGTSNPDIESLITATANTTAQSWGHRRFVSRPLAAHTFATADGNWTFSFACLESNTSHNGVIDCVVYVWRPTTGAQVGVMQVQMGATITGTTETAASATAAWAGAQTAIQDGDVLVFDVTDVFTQAMATAYTSSFAYNGTTEASTTTCASFVTPPVALTLFSATATARPQQYVVSQAVQRAASRMSVYRRRSGILVPQLWLPAGA